MGRIASFIVGIFVLGASQVVKGLKAVAPQPEGAPVDYGMIVDYASFGLLVLGAVIVGYTVLAVTFTLALHNYRKRKDLHRQEEEERRNRLEEQGYAQQPAPGEGQYQQTQQSQQQYRRQQTDRRR